MGKDLEKVLESADRWRHRVVFTGTCENCGAIMWTLRSTVRLCYRYCGLESSPERRAELKRANSRRYRETHREQMNEIIRRWKFRHRDQYLKGRRIKYRERRELYLARSKLWATVNRERFLACQRESVRRRRLRMSVNVTIDRLMDKEGK